MKYFCLDKPYLLVHTVLSLLLQTSLQCGSQAKQALLLSFTNPPPRQPRLLAPLPSRTLTQTPLFAGLFTGPMAMALDNKQLLTSNYYWDFQLAASRLHPVYMWLKSGPWAPMWLPLSPLFLLLWQCPASLVLGSVAGRWGSRKLATCVVGLGLVLLAQQLKQRDAHSAAMEGEVFSNMAALEMACNPTASSQHRL